MYQIFKASDELKQNINNFINVNGIETCSSFNPIDITDDLNSCCAASLMVILGHMIIYDILLNLEKDNYGLLCNDEHYTSYLYKLSDDIIVFVHSETNGFINKVEMCDDSFKEAFDNSYRDKNNESFDWEKYEKEKSLYFSERIHPDCIIP